MSGPPLPVDTAAATSCTSASPGGRERGGTGSVRHEDVLERFRAEWTTEQADLRQKLDITDTEEWQNDSFKGLTRVAGVDISFAKDNAVDACITLIILEYPSMKVVHEVTEMVSLDLPYISGFLAFREVPHIARVLGRLREESPEVFPQVVLMDGNGVLHPRGFGAASHIGVVCGVPTLGVAKKFLAVPDVDGKALKTSFSQKGVLESAGDAVPIVGTSGTLHGYALRATKAAPNPVFVSAGHRITQKTALALVKGLCKVRVPEPIRQADLRSRAYLRDNGLL